MSERTAAVRRATKETQVEVELNLDGTGTTDIDTGVPFFDHMLSQLGKHGCLDLRVKASGDTHIDAHHTVEDTAITLSTRSRTPRSRWARRCARRWATRPGLPDSA